MIIDSYHLMNLKFSMRSKIKMLLKGYKKTSLTTALEEVGASYNPTIKLLVKPPLTSFNCWLYSYRLMCYLHALKKFNHGDMIKNNKYLHSISLIFQYDLFGFPSNRH